MLTEPKVKAAKPEAKEYKLSDAGGLYLLIRPTGKKYWKYKYRFYGKEKKLSIGVYPEISIKQARNIHQQAKEQLAQGVDPQELKKLEKLQQGKNINDSFSNVSSEWYQKQETTWAASTAKKNKAILTSNLLPYLQSRPMADIKTFELVGCLKRMTDRGALESAHKARQMLNQIFRYAKHIGMIEHNPASDLVGALPPQKVSHMAAITEPKAFAKLLVDIDRYEGTHIARTALALAPLLFQRPGELCAMEWAEIDLEQALWVIPRIKKKERNQIEGDHIVPLSPPALELLKDIQPLTGRSRFVFPNQRNHDSHIRTETLNKALRKLGYDTKTEQCAHGFRACARTLLDEELQLKVEWIEQQLAHKVKDALGNAYNRTKHLPQRIDMMNRWANYCQELKRQHLAGNVITASFGGVM